MVGLLHPLETKVENSHHLMFASAHLVGALAVADGIRIVRPYVPKLENAFMMLGKANFALRKAAFLGAGYELANTALRDFGDSIVDLAIHMKYQETGSIIPPQEVSRAGAALHVLGLRNLELPDSTCFSGSMIGLLQRNSLAFNLSEAYVGALNVAVMHEQSKGGLASLSSLIASVYGREI